MNKGNMIARLINIVVNVNEKDKGELENIIIDFEERIGFKLEEGELYIKSENLEFVCLPKGSISDNEENE
ncbi:MAG: hypothetical protein ACRCVJ_18520 [Clostridium sp.]|uniref:hypothetical protein n=1 Tax=Clostridium sp. TaxID=1506 RepID=UPI003F343B7C